MKDVYVIKVKTKPPLSSLYPSERRYSSSTVGGLSLVHLGLSILAFLLGALARSLQGPIMAFGCLVPFASGLLAWRRWYIDKNISFFFYGSLFSLLVSTLCGVATAFDIAAVTEVEIGPAWNLEKIFSYPQGFGAEKKLVGIIDRNETEDEVTLGYNSNETLARGDKYEGDNPAVNSSHALHETRNRLLSLWRGDSAASTRASILLDVNVLVTCVLEICWSLLSVKISLRGMRNQLVENCSYDNRNGSAPKPREDNRNPYSYGENFRGLNDYRGNSTTEIRSEGPRLPMPESNKEFRERVERFLANQAAHRIVEGSCS